MQIVKETIQLQEGVSKGKDLGIIIVTHFCNKES